MGSLIIFTDAGAPVDPRAADISAHGARCNADLGIVANALHLAGISFGINIENGDGGRVAQYIPREPDGSGHTDPRLAEGFQVQVLRPGELRDAIRHYVHFSFAQPGLAVEDARSPLMGMRPAAYAAPGVA